MPADQLSPFWQLHGGFAPLLFGGFVPADQLSFFWQLPGGFVPANHNTVQWHPAMAPNNCATSIPTKLVVALLSSTLQWHPAIAPRPLRQNWSLPFLLAPCNCTLQWHPATAPCPLLQSWESPSPLTIAHYNGTTSTPPKLAVTPPQP